MALLTLNDAVKRWLRGCWKFGMSDFFTAVYDLIVELKADHATFRTAVTQTEAAVTEIQTQLNYHFTTELANCVLPAPTLAGLSADSNAENCETDNAIDIRYKGQIYKVAAIGEMDISALSAKKATIGKSKHGVGWVFVNPAGTGNVEVDTDTQAYDTAIEAFATYSAAANTLPPAATDVCIGAIHVQEGGSGTFTWGDDSISDETEAFIDFCGLPGVEAAVASFAADEDAATFMYGAGVVRLGSGVRVALSGEASGVTIAGTNVATTKFGAWLVYALADDSVKAVQLGYAYATLAAAQAAVLGHELNPYLPVIGVIYVQNGTSSNFQPGTTKFDAEDITATFVKVGPGADIHEMGRSALGQPYSLMDTTMTAAPATIASDSPDDPDA